MVLLAVTSLVAGCKIAVMVPSGGDVTSASGTSNCAGGSLCEHNITDSTFNESFTAIARPGYVFTKWNKGAGFLCGDSTNPTCTISNVGTTGNVAIEAVIATGQFFYAMPLFEFVGINTDGDEEKDHIDEDDDNDGVLDVDDNCPLVGPNLDSFGCPTTLDWSGTPFSSELMGINAINVDGTYYDVSFVVTGTLRSVFYDNNTQSFKFTFSTVETARSAVQKLASVLTSVNVQPHLLNGIHYWSGGEILTPYAAVLVNTSTGPRYRMPVMTARGVGVPPDNQTTWSVVHDADGHYADADYTGGGVIIAVWEKSAEYMSAP